MERGGNGNIVRTAAEQALQLLSQKHSVHLKMKHKACNGSLLQGASNADIVQMAVAPYLLLGPIQELVRSSKAVNELCIPYIPCIPYRTQISKGLLSSSI